MAQVSEQPQKVVRLKTTDLHFDPRNPRFFRLNNAADDQAVIEEMLDDEGVQDLMASIGQQGFFEGEPLLVVQEDGKWIVVEGNRRLAAVKLLNRELDPPKRRRNSVEMLRQEAAIAAPNELPCIEYPSRRQIVSYLGYRHITGIKEWDSLSKARYLADLRQEFYADLEGPAQMKALAKHIGSRSDYVAQLLAALELYTRAKDAGFFDLPMATKDVEFSYLTTALNYRNIADWLGLEGSGDVEMPGLDTGNLKRMYAWMFPRDQQGRTILGESRNIRDLAEIVRSPEAVQALEESGKLSEAYLYSEGPERALIQALEEAQGRARTAWGMLLTTKLTQEHLALAETLFEHARDIRNTIRDRLED